MNGREIAVRDPLAEYKVRLLPPLKNPKLGDAADALTNGHTQLAETLVDNYLRKKPEDPDALNIKAEIARRAKRFEEAEALLERCVKRAPDKVGFRYNYSVVLRHRHKYEQALAQIEELLREYPGNPLFCDQKATILTRAGQHAEAVVCRRALIEQFPLWPEGWLYY